MFEKVSRSLKYDTNFFSSTNIYIWTPQPITLPHSRCACGVTTQLTLTGKSKFRWSTTCVFGSVLFEEVFHSVLFGFSSVILFRSSIQQFFNLMFKSVSKSIVKGAVAYRVSSFPKYFVFALCLQAVYQLSGPVCKATWRYCASYSASYLHFTLCD